MNTYIRQKRLVSRLCCDRPGGYIGVSVFGGLADKPLLGCTVLSVCHASCRKCYVCGLSASGSRLAWAGFSKCQSNNRSVYSHLAHVNAGSRNIPKESTFFFLSLFDIEFGSSSPGCWRNKGYRGFFTFVMIEAYSLMHMAMLTEKIRIASGNSICGFRSQS